MSFNQNLSLRELIDLSASRAKLAKNNNSPQESKKAQTVEDWEAKGGHIEHCPSHEVPRVGYPRPGGFKTRAGIISSSHS